MADRKSNNTIRVCSIQFEVWSTGIGKTELRSPDGRIVIWQPVGSSVYRVSVEGTPLMRDEITARQFHTRTNAATAAIKVLKIRDAAVAPRTKRVRNESVAAGMARQAEKHYRTILGDDPPHDPTERTAGGTPKRRAPPGMVLSPNGLNASPMPKAKRGKRVAIASTSGSSARQDAKINGDRQPVPPFWNMQKVAEAFDHLLSITKPGGVELDQWKRKLFAHLLPMPRVQHRKRGSSYDVFSTTAKLQIDVDKVSRDKRGTLQLDNMDMVVYVGNDNDVWVRPYHEFVDGRFATLIGD